MWRDEFRDGKEVASAAYHRIGVMLHSVHTQRSPQRANNAEGWDSRGWAGTPCGLPGPHQCPPARMFCTGSSRSTGRCTMRPPRERTDMIGSSTGCLRSPASPVEARWNKNHGHACPAQHPLTAVQACGRPVCVCVPKPGLNGNETLSVVGEWSDRRGRLRVSKYPCASESNELLLPATPPSLPGRDRQKGGPGPRQGAGGSPPTTAAGTR